MSAGVARETIRGNGHALVEREIIASGAWFIGIRWLAGFGVLLSTVFVTAVLDIRLPGLSLYVIGLAILGYNTIFWWARRYLLQHQPRHVDSFWLMTNWQISLDYVATTALIHFTGGLESPVTFYFIFHIIIAAILLSPRTTYLYATLAVLLVAATAGLEYAGVLPHIHIQEFIDTELSHVPTYIVGKLAFFFSTVYVTAYLASTLNIRLRERADAIVELSQRLSRAYSRLEILFESAQAVNSTLELQQVLQRLVRGTVAALGVRACSIRLLDETGTRLRVVATDGLSDAYVKKGDLVLERNPLARQVLAGRTVITNDISTETSLQYPDEALSEGICSMLSAALRGKVKPLGMIRAYAAERGRFTQEDANFLTAIASQGSVALENAMAYEELGRVDQAKSKFVLTVTHELRSPVSVIRSLLRTITAGYTGSLTDEQRDMVMRSLRRADFLQTLIDDLLDLAAGKSEIGPAEERVLVPLDKVVDHVVKQFEVNAQEKQIRLEWTCEGDPSVVVLATPEGMERILGNLVSNAIKYTPAGGAVRITIRGSADHVRILVEDSGIGIPEDALPHLFEEFYRAPNAKAVAKEGTGLGLAISRDLVVRYGGSIGVQSQVGQGTTFTLTFPRWTARPEHSPGAGQES